MARRMATTKNKAITTQNARTTLRAQQSTNRTSERNNGRSTTRGRKGINLSKKTTNAEGKYPQDSQMHETEPQEHDTWANMMMRYTKDRHTLEHKSRTSIREHECERCGEPFLIRTGMRVHQRLKSQFSSSTTQEDQNNKARASKNCNYRRPGSREMQTHLFYHCREKHTSRTQLTGCQCKKNRIRMIHTGVHKEDTTCIRNNMTYNAGTQQWTCNMCSRTGQPQDVQNAIRHILWR